MKQNTIFGIRPEVRAPWRLRLMAKLFGKKFSASDGTCIVKGRWFAGKLYIDDVRAENSTNDETSSESVSRKSSHLRKYRE